LTDKFAEFVSGAGRHARLGGSDALVIRPAHGSDLAAAAAIAAAREGEPIERWVVAFDRMHQECSLGKSLFLVAAHEERIIGYGKAAHFSPPEGSPPNVAPEGWYLTGVVVHPEYRRRGVGSQLTIARLAWIEERSARAYYVANERNRVSIALHRAVGFVEVTRDFHHPHVRFEGGAGILFVKQWASRSTGG
jgi:ribosomal protein S18 acetylase RimI-like enzyme